MTEKARSSAQAPAEPLAASARPAKPMGAETLPSERVFQSTALVITGWVGALCLVGVGVAALVDTTARHHGGYVDCRGSVATCVCLCPARAMRRARVCPWGSRDEYLQDDRFGVGGDQGIQGEPRWPVSDRPQEWSLGRHHRYRADKLGMADQSARHAREVHVEELNRLLQEHKQDAPGEGHRDGGSTTVDD